MDCGTSRPSFCETGGAKEKVFGIRFEPGTMFEGNGWFCSPMKVPSPWLIGRGPVACDGPGCPIIMLAAACCC
jgi:hypothetical protein